MSKFTLIAMDFKRIPCFLKIKPTVSDDMSNRGACR